MLTRTCPILWRVHVPLRWSPLLPYFPDRVGACAGRGSYTTEIRTFLDQTRPYTIYWEPIVDHLLVIYSTPNRSSRPISDVYSINTFNWTSARYLDDLYSLCTRLLIDWIDITGLGQRGFADHAEVDNARVEIEKIQQMRVVKGWILVV